MTPKKLAVKPIVWVIALVIALSVAFYLQKNILPQEIRTVQMNLNVPVRYAFVSDGESPQLAVLDTYENRVVNQLELSVPADNLAVSRLGGYLIYAQQQGQMIYRLNLENNQTKAFSIDYPLQSLTISADGQRIIYSAEQAVVVLNPQGESVKELPVSGKTSVIYGSEGQFIYIAEQSQGRIIQYDIKSNTTKLLTQVNATISPMSLMPDGSALLFSGDNSQQKAVYRYDLATGLLNRVDLPIVVMRPYIPGDNRRVLLLGQGDLGELTLYQLNPKTLAIQSATPLEPFSDKGHYADNIRSGWLDQTLLVATEKHLYAIGSDTLVVKELILPAPVKSMLVSADSKTLMATLVGEKQLLTYDIRQQQVHQMVKLPLNQPDGVVMGQTNTLCH